MKAIRQETTQYHKPTMDFLTVILMLCRLLQPPAEYNMNIAHRRAGYCDEDDLFDEVGIEIRKYGYPHIAAIGSSHITHWATHKRHRTCAEDKDMLRNIGGTKFINVINQFGGIGLPRHKMYLGNQWQKMKNLKWKPHYVTLACGSNDTDDANRCSRCRTRKSMTDLNFRKETRLTIANWYKDLKYIKRSL